jgi:hypothetical protein
MTCARDADGREECGHIASVGGATTDAIVDGGDGSSRINDYQNRG